MDYIKLMLVFVVLFVNIEAGGHGEKHHNHVRVHVPKFVHHDHHTKTITIHHHHHKPKKEHHHHHHHHHKPKAPEGHHYHHHKKTSTHSVSKGHSSHGNHGHHGHHSKHGHQSHQGHQGHHGHEHKHHDVPLTYDSPTIHYEPPNYEPPSVNYPRPSLSYNPTSVSEEDFGFRSSIPGSPKLHGVVHTVKETKVFDSLPNAFAGTAAGNSGNTGSHGYEVTEQGEEAVDDIFTSVNSLSQTYPGTYGFIRNAAPENTHDPFVEIATQNSNQVSSGNHFEPASNPSFGNVQDFSTHSDPFHSPLPSQSIQPSEFSNEFDDAIQVTGSDSNHLAGFSSAEDFIDENPTSFNREAGIQQIINTGGVETLSY